MTEIALTKEVLELKNQAPVLMEATRQVAISDSHSYAIAGELWLRLKIFREKWLEKMAPIKKSADQTHKMIVALEKEIDRPAEERQTRIKGLMEEYDRDQQEKARKQEVELARIARESQEARILEAAVEAEKSGDKALALTIIETPVQTPAVVIPKDVPKLEGGPVFREVWQFEIERADLIPRAYLIPDEKKIGQVVRAMKDQTNIPGIKVFSKRV